MRFNNRQKQISWIWNQIYFRHFWWYNHNKSDLPSQPLIQWEIGSKAESKHHWYTGEVWKCLHVCGCFQWRQNCTTRWWMRDNNREFAGKMSWHCNGACNLHHFTAPSVQIRELPPPLWVDRCHLRTLCQHTTSVVLSAWQRIRQPKDSRADWSERTDSRLCRPFTFRNCFASTCILMLSVTLCEWCQRRRKLNRN